MKFSLNTIKVIFEKHGPTILSYTAIFGVAATMYLMHRAEAKNAINICANMLTEDDDTIYADVRKDVYKRNWKTFIPPAACGLATIGLIFGANKWHLSKEAALASVAIMYKTAGEELEAKLKDEFGEEKVEEVKRKIAEEKLDANRPPWEEKHPDRMRIWEPYTNQWLELSQKDILWIEICANKLLSQKYTVTMNDILGMYGAKKTKAAENIGWSYDDETFCELAGYYGAGAWIDLCPQLDTDSNGNMYYVMDYGIHPNDISHLPK